MIQGIEIQCACGHGDLSHYEDVDCELHCIHCSCDELVVGVL